MLRERPDELVLLYNAVEAFARSLGPIEIVARERYVLFRSVRIFTELVIMKDAVRIAIHLSRRVDDPLFFKIVADEKKTTHVAKLVSPTDLETVKPLVAEAYAFSLGPSGR